MFSWTLFKTTSRKNVSLFIIFLSVHALYIITLLFMFNPEDMEAISSMLDLFPPDLMAAMGFSSLISDLTSYLASWLYGLLMTSLPMVYSIILSHRLVAKMVDNSSFACLLSTPNRRTKIIFTQGVFAISSLTVLFAVSCALGILASSALFPRTLDNAAFIELNVTTLLVSLTVLMISYFSSCLFNESGKALGFGAGIPITLLLMNMLGNVSEQLPLLKKLSVFGWYDPVDLVRNGSGVWVNLLYLAFILIMFAASLVVFKHKQLPL